jgi:DNA-binding SARP family transcriptional activator
VAWCFGDFKKSIEHGELSVQIIGPTDCALPHAEALVELSLSYFDDGQHQKAREFIAKAKGLAHGMAFLDYTILIYEARFAFELGEEEDGFAFLRQGLALGSQQGYVNMFRWNNQTMSRLCAKALEHNIEVEYVRRLIRQRGLEPDNESQQLENWPHPIRIHALGQFSMTARDEPLRSSGKQQRKPLELLQLLVSAGERGLPVEQAVEALWPDMDSDKAYNAHTSAVYRLRKLVGNEEAILTQEGRVTLNPLLCFVDAWAFQHLVEQATRRRATNPEEAAQMLVRAIDTYRGAFLNDEQSGEWAMGYRERLHSKFVHAVLDVGRHHEERLNYEHALDCYQRGLERDDLIEAIYQRILVCCHELGRRAEGLAVFEQCRRRLQTLLDITPSAQTLALRDQLIAG